MSPKAPINPSKIPIAFISLAVLTLILTAGASSVLAYQGDYSQEGPNCTPEKHAIMEAAFDSNDYDAWKEQVNGRGRITQIINEDNFPQFVEAHRLASDGDIAGADAIRAELGLRTSNGERMGAGYKGANGERSGQMQGKGYRGSLDQ